MNEDTVHSRTTELAFTDDAVTTSYLAYKGISPTHIEFGDSGRIAFVFDASTLRRAQTELDSGSAQVDPIKYSAILRRIVRTYLTKQARKRLRTELEGDVREGAANG